MNRQQAKELFTLITTVRHVKEMDVTASPYTAGEFPNKPACLLSEGMRHGLYNLSKVEDPDTGGTVFHQMFGCSEEEGRSVVFHNHLRDSMSSGNTTGEVYYQAGEELLIKYGYSDLFEEAHSFNEIMAKLKGETVIWEGQDIPVTGVIS